MARTTTFGTEVRSRIEAFLEQISSLVKQSAIGAVREALGDGAAPAAVRRGPGRPRGSGAKSSAAKSSTQRRKVRRGGKRSPEEVDRMAGQVLTYVRSNPGEGLESIGRGLRLPTKELKLPVQKLLASKSVRTTGQKRGTKYFPSGRALAARTASANGRRKARRKKAKRRARRAA